VSHSDLPPGAQKQPCEERQPKKSRKVGQTGKVRLTNTPQEKARKDQDTYERSKSSEQLVMDQLERRGQQKSRD